VQKTILEKLSGRLHNYLKEQKQVSEESLFKRIQSDGQERMTKRLDASEDFTNLSNLEKEVDTSENSVKDSAGYLASEYTNLLSLRSAFSSTKKKREALFLSKKDIPKYIASLKSSAPEFHLSKDDKKSAQGKTNYPQKPFGNIDSDEDHPQFLRYIDEMQIIFQSEKRQEHVLINAWYKIAMRLTEKPSDYLNEMKPQDGFYQGDFADKRIIAESFLQTQVIDRKPDGQE
jgi:hypothetical protein